MISFGHQARENSRYILSAVPIFNPYYEIALYRTILINIYLSKFIFNNLINETFFIYLYSVLLFLRQRWYKHRRMFFFQNTQRSSEYKMRCGIFAAIYSSYYNVLGGTIVDSCHDFIKFYLLHHWQTFFFVREFLLNVEKDNKQKTSKNLYFNNLQ